MSAEPATTTAYAPGMRVIIRDEEWIIKKVFSGDIPLGKNTAKKFPVLTLHCQGLSPLVKGHEAQFLVDLENNYPKSTGSERIVIVNPAQVDLQADHSSHYKRSLLFLESQWRQQIPTDSNLHIGHKAVMDLMPFQLEPAQIALRRPRQRILIADSVGLGKTLEAGILMSELIARGKGQRILVVAVKSMMLQFQKELWNRFTIPLVRLDSNRIHKIRAELPSNYNPFNYYDKTIVSIDTLKRENEYRTHLEGAYWDIIVIDEAQNVAERGGESNRAQRAKLAKLLASHSDTMIMLSATPHDGRSRSFASLMNILDPAAIANPDKYTVQDIHGLFVRRFKKDIKNQVKGTFYERKVWEINCPASPNEEEAFNVLTNMQLQMDMRRAISPGRLFRVSLEKALFSSPAACLSSVEARLKKLRKNKYPEDFPDVVALEKFAKALKKIDVGSFSRYQKLLELLRSKEYAWKMGQSTDRLVIFTERIDTMEFLAGQLRKDLKLNENAVVTLSGQMSDTEQQKIVENFGLSEAPVRVLVASDVASEGLNLHYLSHRLIHFDIPWSLMVFQQRNGRIDRYGQEKEPLISYMFIKSSNQRIAGDARIMEILAHKAEQAQANIGDSAHIRGLDTQEAEEEWLGEQLEKGLSAEAFGAELEASEFDPFAELLAAFPEDEDDSWEEPEMTYQEPVEQQTLLSDYDYLQQAFAYLNTEKPEAFDLFNQQSHATNLTEVTPLSTVKGLEIKLSEGLRQRLISLMPPETLPSGAYLRLSTDRKFCMKNMKLSMQNSLESKAWPDVQYLWRLHPLFNLIDDKMGLLFGRGQAPLLLLPQVLAEDEFVFVLSGSVPNIKAMPLVDEWFALRFRQGQFTQALSMPEVLRLAGITDYNSLINLDLPFDSAKSQAQALLPAVIAQAKLHLEKYAQAYREQSQPQIAAEQAKLAQLKQKYQDYFNSLAPVQQAKNQAKKAEHENLMNELEKNIVETLAITDNPYLRVMAVLAGARYEQ